MKVTLGYACLTKTLDITSSKTTTFTNYIKNPDINKIDNLIKENLTNLREILKYNLKNDITFFRLSSQIIPLATKDEVVFDYIKPYQKYYNKLIPLANQMRLDFHPDQFTVLNSIKKEVINNSIKNLEYHYQLLNALNIKNKILILHVGSSVLGKINSIKRFINNYNKLPNHLKQCIAIENDDKVYNLEDCIYISKKINIPFVLDYHHHVCNNVQLEIKDNLKDIINSWKNQKPKMHYSSPKSKLKKEFRTHHDYINPYEFIEFLKIIKSCNTDIDIMIEAKAKDEAVFRLIRQLKYLTNYQIKGTTIYL